MSKRRGKRRWPRQRLPGRHRQRGVSDIGTDAEGVQRLFRQFSFRAPFQVIWRPRRPARSPERVNVNVIVARKKPESSDYHSTRPSRTARRVRACGEWASTDRDDNADAVLARTGDVPTLEALVAAQLLRAHFPELRLRFVNVIDLMTLQSAHAPRPGWTTTRTSRCLASRKKAPPPRHSTWWC